MKNLAKVVFLAVFGVTFLGAHMARASVIHYYYMGLPIDICVSCDDPDDRTDTGDWIEGGFTIDERLFPGGTLRNATLMIDGENTWIGEDEMLYRWQVTSGSSVYSGSFLDWSFEGPDYSFMGILDWTYPYFHSWAMYFSFLWLEFDASRNIVVWYGDAGEGGTGDRFTSPLYDLQATGHKSAGPGTWTKTIIQASPAPIPLGGALGYLLTSLFVLTGFRLRNRRTFTHLV